MKQQGLGKLICLLQYMKYIYENNGMSLHGHISLFIKQKNKKT